MTLNQGNGVCVPPPTLYAMEWDSTHEEDGDSDHEEDNDSDHEEDNDDHDTEDSDRF